MQAEVLSKLETILQELTEVKNELTRELESTPDRRVFNPPPKSMTWNSTIEQVRKKILERQGQQISARTITKAIWGERHHETQDYYNRYVSGILSRWAKEGFLQLIRKGVGTRRAIYAVPVYGPAERA